MQVKRKRLDRGSWTDILDKDYRQRRVQAPFFTGLAALLDIRRVTRPIVWEFPEGPVTTCDAGMQWLELLPEDGSCVVTAMVGGGQRSVSGISTSLTAGAGDSDGWCGLTTCFWI